MATTLLCEVVKDVWSAPYSKHILQKMTTKLINAVELEPYDFLPSDYHSEYPTYGTEQEIHQYYADYWQSTPFAHLPRVVDNWWLVDMTLLDELAIEAFIKKMFADIDMDEDDYLDCIWSFMGGIIVMQDGNAEIIPHCCGDVFDIKNWEEMLSTPTDKWCGVWNGHPGISYRMVGDNIEFANHTKEVQPIEELTTNATMPISDFKVQIEQMIQIQMTLYQRLRKKLQAMGYDDYQDIAKSMCYVY